MIAFADASALVELSAEVSRVEVVAALWRKARVDDVDVETAALPVRGFMVDDEGTPAELPRFHVALTAAPVLRRACRHCGVPALHAHDAVELATALLVAEESGKPSRWSPSTVSCGQQRCARVLRSSPDQRWRRWEEGAEAAEAGTRGAHARQSPGDMAEARGHPGQYVARQ